MLQTKFKYWAYANLIIALALIILLYTFIVLFISSLYFYGIILITFVLALIVWLILIELKNKVTTINIEGDIIKCRKFLGWGSQSTFQFKEISGYKTCTISGELDSSEVIYLIVNNKKVIRLSEFYHLNYYEIKLFFKGHFKNLGTEGYNLFS